jgi:hypothetical protein
VSTGFAANRLGGRLLDAPMVYEREGQVLTDVAAPERAVAVGRHHARPAVARRLRGDARSDVFGGLDLHGREHNE